MRPLRITFSVREHIESRKVHVDVVDESGDVRDAYVLSIAAAGELSRRLADACTAIVMVEGSKLADHQISCVSGRH